MMVEKREEAAMASSEKLTPARKALLNVIEQGLKRLVECARGSRRLVAGELAADISGAIKALDKIIDEALMVKAEEMVGKLDAYQQMTASGLCERCGRQIASGRDDG
jgi:hypothetical protein